MGKATEVRQGKEKISGPMSPNLGPENVPLLNSKTDALASRVKCFWMLMEPLKM